MTKTLGVAAARVLRILGTMEAPATAKEIGQALHGDAFDNRTRSASATGNARQLISEGLAARTLKSRELYAYEITEAGRAALANVYGAKDR